jgi:hypothetical protein
MHEEHAIHHDPEPRADADEPSRDGGVKVYAYGCCYPTVQEELVRETMRAAARYRNTLVEIERGRRAALRDLDAAHGLAAPTQALAEASARCVEISQRAKTLRAQTRTRATDDGLAAALKAARAVQNDARKAFRAARKALRASQGYDAACALVNERALELTKSARSLCGVYWGTYQLVEDAMRAARAAPLYAFDAPNDPAFVPWAGEGAVSVQLVGGLDVQALAAGANTQVQLREAPLRTTLGHNNQRPDPNSRRSQKQRRMVLRLRVASDGRAPVWAEFPVVLHRPLPEGARIKRVTVHLRRIGPREAWSAQFTVEMPAPKAPRCGIGAVAVNFGWRVVEGGMRVATWRGDGMARAEEVRVADADVARLRRAQELRSVRDVRFDAARAGFVALLRRTPDDGADVPAWVRAAGRTAAAWRSADRLARIVLRWARERELRVGHADYLAWTEPGADAWGLRDLALWRYHDHHLWEWETSQHTKALRARRENYRLFAAGLVRRFGVLVIEDFDMAKTAKRPDVGEEEHGSAEAARSNRQIVSPSELRHCLVSAFVAAGGRVVKVDPDKTTAACHRCGHVEAWDQAAKIMHRCGGCGAVWDQDVNNVENLLQRSCERRDGGENPGPARGGGNALEVPGPRVSRWVKARANRKAREGGDGPARGVT